VLKRARFFLTCDGRYYGGKEQAPEKLRTLFALEELSVSETLGLAAQTGASSPYILTGGSGPQSGNAHGKAQGKARQGAAIGPSTVMLDGSAIRKELGGGEKAQLTLFEQSIN
jgi:hypothetical protein